jgi:phosphomannomutase/phosphoglucomutase
MSIFKACDIRGVYPRELDERHAFLIGRAIASELRGADCALGGDVRPSTPALKSAVCEGLVKSGSRVFDLGILPTPVVYWARRSLNVAGAVIITASHNPPRYNGIKCMMGDRPTTPDQIERIERRVREQDFAEGEGQVARRDVRGAYLEWLRGRFGSVADGMRVVADAGNGCAGTWAPEALRIAGCQVEELYCAPDGTFPNRSPNPSGGDVLGEASRLIVDRAAQLGVAFDGDGDRAVFLDEKGRFVEGDKVIIVFARDVLAARAGGKVVYDLKCTRRVAEEIRRAGGVPIAERSGYAFIKNRLMDEGAVFAGEASGHFFFPEIGGDDGTYAALRMVEIIARTGKTLSQLVADIPPYFVSPDIRMERPRGDGAVVIERLKQVFADRPQDYTDGVRIEFERGWALCRMSVTEPVLTLRFEGDTPADMERIRALVLAQVPAP